MPDVGKLVSFAGCDYLGLSVAATVRNEFCAGANAFVVSACASLATTGRTSAHEDLELALAGFLGVESAAVLPDAFLANLAVVESLSPQTRLFLDERAHPSLLAAARSTGRPYETFSHVNVETVRSLLGRSPAGEPVALLTDGVFTPSGRRAPLGEYLDLLPPSGILIVDDCHGLGVLGRHGRGSTEDAGLGDARVILVATLAKAFGCYGGVIAGATTRLASIREQSMAYVATTALPPALAVAGREALRLFVSEPQRLATLWQNTLLMRAGLEALGFSFAADPFPVFALVLETSGHGPRLETALLEEGIRLPFLSYPGGPSAGCLRATVSAVHTAEQVERLMRTLDGVLRQVGACPAPLGKEEE